MSKKRLALITITNGLHVTISGTTDSAEVVEVCCKLTRIDAQRIAGALLDYADPISRRKESQLQYMGEYLPNSITKGVVRLSSLPEIPASRPIGKGR